MFQGRRIFLLLSLVGVKSTETVNFTFVRFCIVGSGVVVVDYAVC